MGFATLRCSPPPCTSTRPLPDTLRRPSAISCQADCVFRPRGLSPPRRFSPGLGCGLVASRSGRGVRCVSGVSGLAPASRSSTAMTILTPRFTPPDDSPDSACMRWWLSPPAAAKATALRAFEQRLRVRFPPGVGSCRSRGGCSPPGRFSESDCWVRDLPLPAGPRPRHPMGFVPLRGLLFPPLPPGVNRADSALPQNRAVRDLTEARGDTATVCVRAVSGNRTHSEPSPGKLVSHRVCYRGSPHGGSWSLAVEFGCATRPFPGLCGG